MQQATEETEKDIGVVVSAGVGARPNLNIDSFDAEVMRDAWKSLWVQSELASGEQWNDVVDADCPHAIAHSLYSRSLGRRGVENFEDENLFQFAAPEVLMEARRRVDGAAAWAAADRAHNLSDARKMLTPRALSLDQLQLTSAGEKDAERPPPRPVLALIVRRSRTGGVEWARTEQLEDLQRRLRKTPDQMASDDDIIKAGHFFDAEWRRAFGKWKRRSGSGTAPWIDPESTLLRMWRLTLNSKRAFPPRECGNTFAGRPL